MTPFDFFILILLAFILLLVYGFSCFVLGVLVKRGNK